MSLLSLTLVRHGETALNAEGRYQGWIDPPLTPAGEAAARRLAPLLAGAWAAEPGRCTLKVFASDRARALATAALAVPDTPVSADSRLRELDFGVFDGHTWDENLDCHGERFRAWLADPDGAPPPDGERLVAFRQRVGRWLDDVAGFRRVIAFTHAGVMHVILARALQLPLAEARRVRLAPCDAIRLILPHRRGGSWQRLSVPSHPTRDPTDRRTG